MGIVGSILLINAFVEPCTFEYGQIILTVWIKNQTVEGTLLFCVVSFLNACKYFLYLLYKHGDACLSISTSEQIIFLEVLIRVL